MNGKARYLLISMLALCLLWSAAVFAQDTPDQAVIAKIRDEGLNRSQIMDTISWLTDVHGFRLSGSPSLRAAQRWCVEKMKEWGLVNAALEPWGEFGRGWTLRRFSLQMVEPAYLPIIASPQAWTAGTGGVLHGEAVLITAKNEEELARYKGTLRGRIVMVGGEMPVKNGYTADARRYTDDELAKMANPPKTPTMNPEMMAAMAQMGRSRFLRRITDFCIEEGAGVILTASRGTEGTLFVGSAGSRKAGDPPGIPTVSVSADHYNRMVRIIEKGIPVVLDVDIETSFNEDDTQGYNVVAEIPGTDPLLKNEVVMLGGHIDDWHAATGATDNAAGVAVAMEAVRIIKTLGLEPRRTIRVGFWDGEEQGILGSAGYVKKHYVNEDGSYTPEYDAFSVYFNFDNGTGKIRGVYLQGNEAARPIFEGMFTKFTDLGAGTLAPGSTGGTDHLSFDAIGLPAFQWIQDPIEYDTRTHHSNMDDYDHLEAADLKQAATITAAFVWDAATRGEKYPRVPPPVFVNLTAAQMEPFVGTYSLAPMGKGTVSLKDGALVIEVSGYPPVRLRALSENEFMILEVKANVTFARDASGKVTTLTLVVPGMMKLSGPREQ